MHKLVKSVILIFAELLFLVTGGVEQARGQQNGEVTVPLQDQGRHSDSFRIKSSMMPANNSVGKIQYLDANGQPVLVQFTYVGPPKILPIATADSYPEGSTINLICTVSGGQRKGLTLGWMKDGEELSNDESMRYASSFDNISIEKTGVDISILRITNATHNNSGRFTCTAKNLLGEDSTSVNIVINGELCSDIFSTYSFASLLFIELTLLQINSLVELKWSKLPVDTEVGLNQGMSIECDAIGQPQPQIMWTKHPSSMGRGFNGKTGI